MNRAVQVVQRLRGPVVPINVCFNADGTVNYAAVGAYVDWLCEELVGCDEIRYTAPGPVSEQLRCSAPSCALSGPFG